MTWKVGSTYCSEGPVFARDVALEECATQNPAERVGFLTLERFSVQIGENRNNCMRHMKNLKHGEKNAYSCVHSAQQRILPRGRDWSGKAGWTE